MRQGTWMRVKFLSHIPVILRISYLSRKIEYLNIVPFMYNSVSASCLGSTQNLQNESHQIWQVNS